jgi:hypothetical protein
MIASLPRAAVARGPALRGLEPPIANLGWPRARASEGWSVEQPRPGPAPSSLPCAFVERAPGTPPRANNRSQVAGSPIRRTTTGVSSRRLRRSPTGALRGDEQPEPRAVLEQRSRESPAAWAPWPWEQVGFSALSRIHSARRSPMGPSDAPVGSVRVSEPNPVGGARAGGARRSERRRGRPRAPGPRRPRARRSPVPRPRAPPRSCRCPACREPSPAGGRGAAQEARGHLARGDRPSSTGAAWTTPMMRSPATALSVSAAIAGSAGALEAHAAAVPPARAWVREGGPRGIFLGVRPGERT